MVERLADAHGRWANYVERLIEAADEAARKGKSTLDHRIADLLKLPAGEAF
jgi:hypothetical protein